MPTDPIETHHPAFTIFIPTYNRAHTLPRALQSVAAQDFCDFDCLVVDDGSTDDTENLVRDWQANADFPLRYIKQENQGKHGAHNTALRHIQGYFTVILDSDDALTPAALSRFWHHWQTIPLAQRAHFAGVEGLCGHMADGRVAGSRFPEDLCDSHYLAMRLQHGVRGDKKNAVRTDVLKRYPFPCFPNERHVRPSLLWSRLAHDGHLFRYFNEVIQHIEYQPDGLSSDRLTLRTQNPLGMRHYFMEEANRFGKPYRKELGIKSHTNYVRYSLHAGIGLLQQAQDIKEKGRWLLALPKGTLDWLEDRIKHYFRRHR